MSENPIIPVDIRATIRSNTRLSSDVSMLVLHAPDIAKSAIPGQFVNITCSRFLRRPFGIAGVDPVSGDIRIGIQVKGPGTSDIAQRDAGTTLQVLGPLGTGFSLDGVETLIVVAGGTGLFPVLFLLDRAREQGIRTLAFCGYRSEEHAFLTDELAAAGDTTVIASDLGDIGYHGTCVQALADAACEEGDASCRVGDTVVDKKSTLVAAVGPIPMMRAAAEEAERLGFMCQVSLEERMACGIGVCLVCVCKTRSSDPSKAYVHKRCCVEGPVFPAGEVIW